MKKETRTEHIRHIHLAGDMNNNRMEQFNGEVRDREKIMRGLKRKDTPILKGYQFFHNYVRPHEDWTERHQRKRAGLRLRARMSG